MKKKFSKKSLINSALACVLACSATAPCLNFETPLKSITAIAADSYTEGKYDCLTYNKYDDHIEITDFDASATNVVVPAKIEGLPVTVIAAKAFFGEKTYTNENGEKTKVVKTLRSITLPDTLKRIETDAFVGSHYLSEVVIPKSVDYIGDYAFYYCLRLEKITIENPKCHIYGFDDYCADYSTGKWAKISDSSYEAFIKENLIIASDYDAAVLENKSIGEFPVETYQQKAAFTYEEYVNYCAVIDTKSTICNGGMFDRDQFAYYGVIYGYSGSTAADYARLCGKTFISISELISGDVNCDGEINAIDASAVLSDYAIVSTGDTSLIDDLQKTAADVNGDGVVDARDASVILSYYAYTATGGTESLEDFMKK